MHGSGAGFSEPAPYLYAFVFNRPFLCFHSRTMDGAGGFVPKFMVQQQSQMVDKVAALMSLVQLARMLWPHGRKAVEHTINYLAGQKGINPEEVYAHIDWEQAQNITNSTETDSSSPGSGSKKYLGFDEIRLTPIKDEVKEQQTAASSIAIGQPGYVAQEVHKHNTKHTSTEPDQTLYKIILASTQMGKAQVAVQQEERQDKDAPDPLQQLENDPYAQNMTEQQKLQAQLTTNNAQLANKDMTVRQLQERLTKLEASMTNKQTVDVTPMIANIATPPTPTENYQLQILGEFKAIKYGEPVNNTTINNRIIIVGTIYDNPRSPSDGGTPFSPAATGSIYQLGGGGPPGGGDEGGGGDGGVNEDDNNLDGGRYGRDYTEFTLVSRNKGVIPVLSGINLQSKPYMPFNKAIRKLIAQGPKGVLLLIILDDVEIYGAETYDNEKLERLVAQVPRAREYNIAIQNVLENYITDIAEGLIKYGVQNGFDAWRKLFNHYVPLAQDLQQLLIQELYDLKPVSEQEVDKLFINIQRISEC